MFRFLDAFADYNPLQDELPQSLYWEIGYIEQQAVSLLPQSFTILELNAGLEILFQLHKIKTSAIIEFVDSFPAMSKYSGVFHSRPFEYFACTNFTEEGRLPNEEKYEWTWLFAVLALASLSDYVAVHHKVYEFDPKESRGIVSAMANSSGQFETKHKHELLLDAMEAIGFARIFSEREQRKGNKKEVAEKIRSTKLGNFQPLKEGVIVLYHQLEKPISNRQAAAEIEDRLDERLKLLSSSKDLRQQIEIWLSQYKRGVLAGQERLPDFDQ